MRTNPGSTRVAPLANRFYTYSLFYAIVAVINDPDDARRCERFLYKWDIFSS